MSSERARGLGLLALAIVASCGAVSCGGESAPSAEPPATEATPATEPATPPEAAAEGSSAPAEMGPAEPSAPELSASELSASELATACERAGPCCRAFVEAIGDEVEAQRATQACVELDRVSELGGAAGEACVAAIDGWRQALELREREVPLACR